MLASGSAVLRNFNPRSPRGLRRLSKNRLERLLPISIHAAQEGCDKQIRNYTDTADISIHAAQEGCDGNPRFGAMVRTIFQSTQPKRAATRAVPPVLRPSADFNPRSPRGLRHTTFSHKRIRSNFNPRSPRGLRQILRNSKRTFRFRFQSTQPKRAATTAFSKISCPPCISIHAAQEGCDRFKK